MPSRVSLSHKQIVFILCTATAVLALVFAVRIWWRAHIVFNESKAQAAVAGELGFSLEPVPAQASSFEPFSAPADFRASVLFEGDLYVCGRSALYRYDHGSKLLKVWHVGQDLPPYPLVTLAVRRGIGTPQLWIATNGGGVLLFDGEVLRNLLPTSKELRNVTALLPLTDGRVLIGTLTAGLYVTDLKHFQLLHSQFTKSCVTALSGSENEVWVGTHADGVWLWRAGEVVRFNKELPDRQVLSLWTTGETTWVGTPLGVAEFVDGRFRRRLAEGIFAQTLAEEAGTLWIGTVDEGMLALRLETRKPRPSAGETLGDTQVQSTISLALARNNILATSANDIREFPGGETVLAAPPSSLAAGHIAALHADSHGFLWVGYFDHGVDVLPMGASGNAIHFEDDALFCINRIEEESASGTIAVATANGLALFDSSRHLRQLLDRNSGLIASHVTDVLFRRTPQTDSSMVVATPAGLSFVEAGSISSIYAFQGLVNNHVYTLAEVDGNLYAGTLGGLSILKNGVIQASFTTANSGLRQNWITASARSGRSLYLGTYGSGVVRLDEQFEVTSFREFSHDRVEINPNAMVATEHGVYAGTAGHGLAIQRVGEEGWRFAEEGLPSENVTALEARGGYLYIGTDNGLVRVLERELIR